MARKIVIIGGGSVLWTPTLSCDMFQQPMLDGSELVLVDIDPAAAKLCKSYLDYCIEKLGVKWKVSIADEDTALAGADCVLVSISTGSFDAMHLDYTIPEKYGVFHSVSDTTGPGGIFRSLRNAPIFLGLAEKMHRLCPDAWMIHVTNPLSQITRLVNATGLVRCCGLCHEVTNALHFMKKYFNLAEDENLDATVVGINHFTFFTEMNVPGVADPFKELTLKKYIDFCRANDSEESSGTVDDIVVKGQFKKYPLYLNFYLSELLGAYPAAGSPHIAENFPRILNDERFVEEFNLWRKGVLPMRPDNKAKLTERLKNILEKGEEPPEISYRSHESTSDVIVGLLIGEPRRIVATLPNTGQISNLPLDASVETWAVVSKGDIKPVQSGEVPMSCLGFLTTSIAEQELTVMGALTRDRSYVRQALFTSPMLHQKERAQELMDEMFEAEKEWLDW